VLAAVKVVTGAKPVVKGIRDITPEKVLLGASISREDKFHYSDGCRKGDLTAPTIKSIR
jgi:hypothetical protein